MIYLAGNNHFSSKIQYRLKRHHNAKFMQDQRKFPSKWMSMNFALLKTNKSVPRLYRFIVSTTFELLPTYEKDAFCLNDIFSFLHSSHFFYHVDFIAVVRSTLLSRYRIRFDRVVIWTFYLTSQYNFTASYLFTNCLISSFTTFSHIIPCRY